MKQSKPERENSVYRGYFLAQTISRALALLAGTGAGMLHAQSAAWPPFYRQPHEQRQAQSMIYGATDLQGSRVEPPREGPRPLAATPQCVSPPGRQNLRAYTGLQDATKEEAADLGVLFQQADGAPAPFLSGHVVLWRAGQYGICTSLGNTSTLVYGAELVVAFLLAPDAPVPGTMAQVEAAIGRKEVSAVGVTLNGSPASPRMQEKITGVTFDMLRSGAPQQFIALQSTWSRLQGGTGSGKVLGVLVASPGT